MFAGMERGERKRGRDIGSRDSKARSVEEAPLGKKEDETRWCVQLQAEEKNERSSVCRWLSVHGRGWREGRVGCWDVSEGVLEGTKAVA